MVVAAKHAGYVEVVGQQEERSQKLLHPHHGLREMLQVHVCHLGRLSASDAIVVLDLKNTNILISSLSYISILIESNILTHYLRDSQAQSS